MATNVCSWCGVKPRYWDKQKNAYSATCSRRCNTYSSSNDNTCVNCQSVPSNSLYGKFCTPACQHAWKTPAGPPTPAPAPTPAPSGTCSFCGVRPQRIEGSTTHAYCGRSCKDMQAAGTTQCLIRNCQNQASPQYGRFCSPHCRLEYAKLTPNNTFIVSLNLAASAQASGGATPSPPKPQAPTGVIGFSDFIAAVERDDLTWLQTNRQALTQQIMVSVDPNGFNLLHTAARKSSVPVLQFLVQCGFNPAIPNPQSGNTILHYAANNANHGAAMIQHCFTTLQMPAHTINQRGLTARDMAPTSLKAAFPPKLLLRYNISTIMSQLQQQFTQQLFPHSVHSNTPTHEKLPRDSTEARVIEYLMNTTILDCHNSYKKYPYSHFKIDCILRYNDQAMWTAARSEPPQPPQMGWFFHGTSKYVCQQIESGGFKQSIQGTFGPGVYLGSNSSVSHLFAQDKDNGDGFSYMLLVYANVGDVFKGMDQPNLANNSLDRDKVVAAAAQQGLKVNTVKQVNPQGYTEHIIYRVQRLYPAYRIKYKPIALDGSERLTPYQ
eukprot:TRINITY_DN541_c0_g1_i1.p1 TRINITY_DN541_c0_g1~~TRINITY_DN541_c0_g1_i1.p1  ORF type:complete len:549 (-),score=40.23 TRINITY_DN541_c0_g1_i1:79-1725(-)